MTTTIEEINPPVQCAEENCDRWVIPFSPGSRAEIVGWAELKAPRSARRKDGGLNKVGRWHATGRHTCATCTRNLKASGHATQGRLL